MVGKWPEGEEDVGVVDLREELLASGQAACGVGHGIISYL